MFDLPTGMIILRNLICVMQPRTSGPFWCSKPGSFDRPVGCLRTYSVEYRSLCLLRKGGLSETGRSSGRYKISALTSVGNSMFRYTTARDGNAIGLIILPSFSMSFFLDP